MNEVDNLTLEYLTSDYQKQKMSNNNIIKKKNKIFTKDKKFYKIRILNLLKLCLSNKSKEEINIPLDLEKNINLLFEKIINHLKEGDKVDIIQTEFEGFSDKYELEEFKEDKIQNDQVKNFTNLYLEKCKKNNLDNFVTITRYNKEEEPEYPKKKKYKIKTKEFKRKGIPKKKNVNINYDEEK